MSDNHRVYEVLEKLVGFPTVTGDLVAQDACLNFTQSLLEDAGLTVQRFNSNGVPSLMAYSRKPTDNKLVLQAHIDVVPAHKAQFKLKRNDGKLLGRGVYDMKFAAAAFIAAAEKLREHNQGLDYAIMFTCDEEVGGEDGVKYLLEREGYRADVCLLPDGADDWEIEEDAKGAWFVSVCADGRAAHGSRPWEGDSAIHKLLDFLQALRPLFLSTNPLDTTLTISEMQAGSAINQVPAQATASLDIRFLNNQAKQDVQKLLYDLAVTHDVKLTTDTQVEASHLDVNLEVVKQWKTAVQQTSGREVGHGMSLGASDANHFSQRNIPTIVTRPPGGCAHGPDEWVQEDDLYKFHDAIVEFIQAVALAED